MKNIERSKMPPVVIGGKLHNGRF